MMWQSNDDDENDFSKVTFDTSLSQIEKWVHDIDDRKVLFMSSTLQNDCSAIVQLAQRYQNNLFSLFRLFHNMGSETASFFDVFKVEISAYEEMHITSANILSSRAASVQEALVQIEESRRSAGENDFELNKIKSLIGELHRQLEATFSAMKLSHLNQIISPRRNHGSEMLENIITVLPLLRSEFMRKCDLINQGQEKLVMVEKEMCSLRELLSEKESRMIILESEMKMSDVCQKEEITAIVSEMSKAKILMHSEREKCSLLTRDLENKLIASSEELARIKKNLANTEVQAVSKMSNLTNEIGNCLKEKTSLQTAVEELKQELNGKKLDFAKLELKIQKQNEVHNSFKEAKASDLLQLKEQLSDASGTHKLLSSQIQELRHKCTELQNERLQLLQSSSQLKHELQTSIEFSKEVEAELKLKMEGILAQKHGAESQRRLSDISLLQCRTQWQLDRHQLQETLHEKNRLQDEVSIMRERVASAFSSPPGTSHEWASCGSLGGTKTSSSGFASEGSERGGSEKGGKAEEFCVNAELENLSSELTSSHSREEKMHSLLREKDEAIRDLQSFFSLQLTAKNEELELVNDQVSSLEEQLSTVMSGLEISASLGDLTCHMGKVVRGRTEALTDIGKMSLALRRELESVTAENEILHHTLSQEKESLTLELTSAQELARKARQEARTERIMAAQLNEKCTRLQTELDSMKMKLDQERNERSLQETLQHVKHRQFESLLKRTTENDNSTTSGVTSLHSASIPTSPI